MVDGAFEAVSETGLQLVVVLAGEGGVAVGNVEWVAIVAIGDELR